MINVIRDFAVGSLDFTIRFRPISWSLSHSRPLRQQIAADRPQIGNLDVVLWGIGEKQVSKGNVKRNCKLLGFAKVREDLVGFPQSDIFRFNAAAYLVCNLLVSFTETLPGPRNNTA